MQASLTVGRRPMSFSTTSTTSDSARATSDATICHATSCWWCSCTASTSTTTRTALTSCCAASRRGWSARPSLFYRAILPHDSTARIIFSTYKKFQAQNGRSIFYHSTAFCVLSHFDVRSQSKQVTRRTLRVVKFFGKTSAAGECGRIHTAIYSCANISDE